MAISDRHGLPIAVHVESATPHEVTLVHATLAQQFIRQPPVRLVGDNAYESDSLDADLARGGVELIAPHRRTRTHRTQDGRQLRRHQRRTFASRLAMNGVGIRAIQEALGHESIAMTVRYSHLSRDFLQEVVDKLVPAQSETDTENRSDTRTDTDELASAQP